MIFRMLKRVIPKRAHPTLVRWLDAIMKLSVVVRIRLIEAYWYDFRRYGNHSGTVALRSRENHEAKMIMAYHRMEKALSLKAPRPGFGQTTVHELLQDLSLYSARYGVDHTVMASLRALGSYFEYNAGQGVSVPELEQRFRSLEAMLATGGAGSCTVSGGVTKLTRSEIIAAANIDFMSFSETRRSIRNFATGDVPISDIEAAVATAQRTPSVCNRQMWKVHVFLDEEKKKSVLKYQNGNRGFGEDASAILIITASLEYFIGVGERNQAYIDGGMYAMTLLYALHSLGYGTCCLNLSLQPKTDQALRRAANIPASEALVMMVAVGRLPEELHVATSPRKEVDQVMVLH